MKCAVLAVLSLASSAAAWGSVEFCPTSPKVDTSYGCATFTFNEPGCFTLPVGGVQSPSSTYPSPRLHNNTRYVNPSDGLRCLIYDQDECTGELIGQVISHVTPKHFETPVSSIRCFDYDN